MSSGGQDDAIHLRYKQQLARLKAQLDAKNSEVDLLQRKLKEGLNVPSDSDSLRRQNNGLKDRVSDLQRELGKAKRQLLQYGSMEDKLHALEKQLSVCKRASQQLQNSNRQLSNENQVLKGKLRRLEEELRRTENQLMKALQESKIKRVVPDHPEAREIQLIKLRDKVAQKKQKLRDLKDQLRRTAIEKQDLAAVIKALERKIKDLAVAHDNAINALQAAHHDVQVRMRKDHQINLQQLDLHHKRQHKCLIQSNQDALQDLTRIHRQQIQRNRRQAQSQLKGLGQRCQILEKRNRELQHVINQGKKRIQYAKHPRFSIDEIARLQEQLALKDSSILTVENQRNAISAELERTLSERSMLIGQINGLRAASMNIRQELDRTRVQSLGLDQLRISKSNQMQNSLQNQIFLLVGQNQKIANESKLLDSKLRETLENNLNLSLKEKLLTQALQQTQLQCNRLSSVNTELAKINQSLSIRVKDLQSQVSPLPILHQRIGSLEGLEAKVYQLQRQRSQVLQRNQILKLDFDQLTRQLRQSHNNCKKLTEQRDSLKHELGRASSLVDYSRDIAARNYEEMQKKRQLYVAQMQRTVNQLRKNFNGEQQALLASFAQYQSRARQQIKQLSDFICTRYEFMLESRDLTSQRQREALMMQYQNQSKNKVRQLQATYQTRERQILHQFQLARQMHQMEKNQLLKNFEFELDKQSPVIQPAVLHNDLESSGSRAYLQGVLKNLRREIDCNRRALGSYK